jgi:hypothetical protein
MEGLEKKWILGVRGPIIQVAGRATRVNWSLVPLRTLSSWILGAPPMHFRGGPNSLS